VSLERGGFVGFALADVTEKSGKTAASRTRAASTRRAPRGKQLPSACRAIISTRSPGSSVAVRVTASPTAPRRPYRRKREQQVAKAGRPIASARVRPNICSAARLNSVILNSSSTVKMPSSASSRSAALRPATLVALCSARGGGPSKGSDIDRLANRRPEPRQPVFRQIVGDAALHGRDGGLLPDGSGDDDEGNVEPALARECQRSQAVEPGAVSNRRR